MADLAQTDKDSPMTLSSEEPKKPRYPDLTLRDDNVDKVKGDHECSVGDEYTAYVRLRVKGVSNDEYGQRLEFDVLSMDDFAPADGQEYQAESEPDEENSKPEDKKKSSKAMTYS